MCNHEEIMDWEGEGVVQSRGKLEKKNKITGDVSLIKCWKQFPEYPLMRRQFPFIYLLDEKKYKKRYIRPVMVAGCVPEKFDWQVFQGQIIHLNFEIFYCVFYAYRVGFTFHFQFELGALCYCRWFFFFFFYLTCLSDRLWREIHQAR